MHLTPDTRTALLAAPPACTCQHDVVGFGDGAEAIGDDDLSALWSPCPLHLHAADLYQALAAMLDAYAPGYPFHSQAAQDAFATLASANPHPAQTPSQAVTVSPNLVRLVPSPAPALTLTYQGQVVTHIECTADPHTSNRGGRYTVKLANGNEATAHGDDLHIIIHPAYEPVDLVASGYDWTCPQCNAMHHEIEIKEHVVCPQCGIVYATGATTHAYG